MTALDLIKQTLYLIGAYQIGQSIPADVASVALTYLNGMIDSWGAQRLTMYVVERNVYTLVSGQQAYTIGPSGDFDQARPVYLDHASIIQNNNPVQPLELAIDPPLTVQEWQAIPVKSITSSLPQKVYYEKTFPLGTLYFWPIPNASPVEVALYMPTALTAFANLTTQYSFPPGYYEALLYNFAVRQALPQGRPLDPDIRQMAINSLAIMKRSNAVLEILKVDPMLTRQNRPYNWISDQ